MALYRAFNSRNIGSIPINSNKKKYKFIFFFIINFLPI